MNEQSKNKPFNFIIGSGNKLKYFSLNDIKRYLLGFSPLIIEEKTKREIDIQEENEQSTLQKKLNVKFRTEIYENIDLRNFIYDDVPEKERVECNIKKFIEENISEIDLNYEYSILTNLDSDLVILIVILYKNKFLDNDDIKYLTKNPSKIHNYLLEKLKGYNDVRNVNLLNNYQYNCKTMPFRFSGLELTSKKIPVIANPFSFYNPYRNGSGYKEKLNKCKGSNGYLINRTQAVNSDYELYFIEKYWFPEWSWYKDKSCTTLQTCSTMGSCFIVNGSPKGAVKDNKYISKLKKKQIRNIPFHCDNIDNYHSYENEGNETKNVYSKIYLNTFKDESSTETILSKYWLNFEHKNVIYNENLYQWIYKRTDYGKYENDNRSIYVAFSPYVCYYSFVREILPIIALKLTGIEPEFKGDEEGLNYLFDKTLINGAGMFYFLSTINYNKKPEYGELFNENEPGFIVEDDSDNKTNMNLSRRFNNIPSSHWVNYYSSILSSDDATSIIKKNVEDNKQELFKDNTPGNKIFGSYDSYISFLRDRQIDKLLCSNATKYKALNSGEYDDFDSEDYDSKNYDISFLKKSFKTIKKDITFDLYIEKDENQQQKYFISFDKIPDIFENERIKKYFKENFINYENLIAEKDQQDTINLIESYLDNEIMSKESLDGIYNTEKIKLYAEILYLKGYIKYLFNDEELGSFEKCEISKNDYYLLYPIYVTKVQYRIYHSLLHMFFNINSTYSFDNLFKYLSKKNIDVDYLNTRVAILKQSIVDANKHKYVDIYGLDREFEQANDMATPQYRYILEKVSSKRYTEMFSEKEYDIYEEE